MVGKRNPKGGSETQKAVSV